MADNSNKDMKALQDAIKQLTGVVAQQVTLSKGSNSSVDRGTRANQNVVQATQVQAEQMGKWGAVFDAGAITLGAAMDVLGNAFGSANELQKRNLAIGGTLAGTMSAQSATVDQLSGGMVGYTNALEIATSKNEAGLNNSSAAMNKMIAGAKATGQNEKALIASMQQLERSGDYSADQQGQLANRLNSLGQSFGISSEQMVGALNKTAGKLVGLANVIGGGAKTQEAVAVAMAALGPGGADMAGQLLQSLSDGGSMIKAQLLGVTEERRALMEGEASAGIDMLIKSGEQSQKILDKFSQGTDKAFGAAMATQIYGKDVLLASQALNKFNAEAKKWADKQGSSFGSQKALQEAYRANLLKEKEANEAFKSSWESFKDRVVSPLQRWATGAATKIFALLENDLWVRVAQGIGVAVVMFATAVTAFATAAAVKKSAGMMASMIPGGGGGAMKMLAPLMSFLGPIMAIVGPILLIAGAIVALLAMTGELKGVMDSFKELWDIIVDISMEIVGIIMDLWKGIMAAVKPIMAILAKVIGVYLKLLFKGISFAFKMLFGLLKFLMKPILWVLKNIIAPVIKFLTDLFVSFMTTLLKALSHLPFLGFLSDVADDISNMMDDTAKIAKNSEKEVEDVKFTSMGFADLLAKEMSIRSTNLIGEQTGTSRLAAQSEGDAHQSSNQGDTKVAEELKISNEHHQQAADDRDAIKNASQETASKSSSNGLNTGSFGIKRGK